MSKKLKFIIILVLLIIIIGIIFGISTIYRFSKIQNIISDVKEHVAKDNYYLKTSITNNGVTKVTEAYYKDGIGKLVAENGIYTWTDGEDAYIVDEENKEIHVLNMENAIGLVSNELFANIYPSYSKNIFEKFFFSGNIKNKIKTEKIDNEKYTKIEVEEEFCKKTYWILNKRNILTKAKMEFPNGDVYNYDYELKFTTTKLKDIELPDIEDYTIINDETGEVILEYKSSTDSNLDTNTEVKVENVIKQTDIPLAG